ncbi:hypothetical protein K488DRAFT_73619 [Vararia minispora EC-137]|uniref:Uncharacterized protein n=1 Tax=Vararia minispora EC-137 TaxID=1314806 RepID=A0ACB8QBH8_9AGAM|nr:hypothetical protein K488DRAFT_73619 [Vararia minispora EC-137]
MASAVQKPKRTGNFLKPASMDPTLPLMGSTQSPATGLKHAATVPTLPSMVSQTMPQGPMLPSPVSIAQTPARVSPVPPALTTASELVLGSSSSRVCASKGPAVRATDMRGRGELSSAGNPQATPTAAKQKQDKSATPASGRTVKSKMRGSALRLTSQTPTTLPAASSAPQALASTTTMRRRVTARQKTELAQVRGGDTPTSTELVLVALPDRGGSDKTLHALSGSDYAPSVADEDEERETVRGSQTRARKRKSAEEGEFGPTPQKKIKSRPTRDAIATIERSGAIQAGVNLPSLIGKVGRRVVEAHINDYIKNELGSISKDEIHERVSAYAHRMVPRKQPFLFLYADWQVKRAFKEFQGSRQPEGSWQSRTFPSFLADTWGPITMAYATTIRQFGEVKWQSIMSDVHRFLVESKAAGFHFDDDDGPEGSLVAYEERANMPLSDHEGGSGDEHISEEGMNQEDEGEGDLEYEGEGYEEIDGEVEGEGEEYEGEEHEEIEGEAEGEGEEDEAEGEGEEYEGEGEKDEGGECSY